MLSKSADRRLDLSAIAKGHGVDVVADHLTSMGYPTTWLKLAVKCAQVVTKVPTAPGVWPSKSLLKMIARFRP